MSETVDGGGTRRDSLEVLRVDPQRWVVVNVDDDTILCQGWRISSGYWFYEPVGWKTYAAAERWVKEGCIAELQETFTNLCVGFQKGIVEEPEWLRREREVECR